MMSDAKQRPDLDSWWSRDHCGKPVTTFPHHALTESCGELGKVSEVLDHTADPVYPATGLVFSRSQSGHGLWLTLPTSRLKGGLQGIRGVAVLP